MCRAGVGAHLLAQQRTSSRGCRRGLLGGPLAHLLELVLNKVFQSSELRLAAATSVHVVLICKEPVVTGAREASRPGGPSAAKVASPASHGGPGCQPPSSKVLQRGTEGSTQQAAGCPIQVGCGDPLTLCIPSPHFRDEGTEAQGQLGGGGICPCQSGGVGD